MASVPQGQPLSILLLGKTGHGKSATGNTILQDHTQFRSEMSFDSVTKFCAMKYGNTGGRELHIVDTPGTMDTKDLRAAYQELKNAFNFRPHGYHAILIVLRMGTRMTEEERNAISLLETVFGSRLMQFTIIVFTHGDSLLAQARRSGKRINFKEYILQKESGYLRDLVSKCDNRCVLINNLAENEAAEAAKIITEIDAMISCNHGQPYIASFAPGDECFPGKAQVITRSWKKIPMKDLETGQEVLTMTGHKFVWSSVYMFGHATKEIETDFLDIQTASRSLLITNDHHLFIIEGEKMITKPAKDVKRGDLLVAIKSANDVYEYEAVVKISYSKESGLYAPFTLTGTIVVDGFLASCYIDMVPPAFAHPLLWPVRQLYKMSPTTLAAISKAGEDGIPRWIRWSLDNVLQKNF